MNKRISIFTAFVFLLLARPAAHAQAITGHITDGKKEPLINSGIFLYHKGSLAATQATDYDGNYFLAKLDTCYYDLLVTYLDYDSVMTTRIAVHNYTCKINAMLLPHDPARYEETIIRLTCPIPMFDTRYPTNRTFSREELDEMGH